MPVHPGNARHSHRRLRGRNVMLAKKVDEELAPRHVLVTTYPERLFERDNGTNSACELFDVGELDVSSKDIAAINELGALLNGSIAQAVSAIAGVPGHSTRWHLVDGVAEAFRRHGYCARDPFFQKLGESCQKQGDVNGGMHPNIAGVRAYAELIYAALDEHVLELPPVPDTPRADIDVDPAAIGFGTVPVGELRFRTVTVENTGEVALTVDAPAGSSMFSWQAVRTNLRPGQRTSISVRFLPSSAGNHTATMRLSSASPGSPHRVTITGRGIGGTHMPGDDDGPIHPN